MKRKIAIATVTAAALIGTGTVSAAAIADDGGQQRSTKSVQVDDRDDSKDRDDKDDRDDRDDDDREAKPAGTTAADAAAAALKAAPGTVTGIDLDEGKNGPVWEVDITKGKTSHEVTLDAKTNKVLSDKKDGEEDAEDTVPSGLKISAADAAGKAAAHGTVTSVDFDDDNRTWEVETTGKDNKESELSVDAKSGKVTPQSSDDDRDDNDDDSDD